MKKLSLLLLLLGCDVQPQIDGHVIQGCVQLCGKVEEVDLIRRTGSLPWTCICNNGTYKRIELR